MRRLAIRDKVPSDSPVLLLLVLATLLRASAPGAPDPVPADRKTAPVRSGSQSPAPKDSSATAPQDRAAALPFTALVLRSEGPDLAPLDDALSLRLPDLPVAAETPANGAPFVFVAVRADPNAPTRHQVGVITSDGRAYFREVDVGADPPARVLASVIANLLLSIAEGTVRPDRTDVPIPPPEADPLPAADPPAEPGPKDSLPQVVPEDRIPPRPAPETGAPPPPPRWQFAPVLLGGAGFGLGSPDFGRALTGGGGSLGLDARAPAGALVGLELRALGQRADGLTLARLRVAALAGYALRRGRFELPVALGLSVEPWWVAPATASSATRGARPLLGALLRVSPGLYLERPRGPLRALRVGPRLELAGSFLIDGGAHVGGVSRMTATGTQQLFRLGGLELHLGLEIALWFAGRPAR